MHKLKTRKPRTNKTAEKKPNYDDQGYSHSNPVSSQVSMKFIQRLFLIILIIFAATSSRTRYYRNNLFQSTTSIHSKNVPSPVFETSLFTIISETISFSVIAGIKRHENDESFIIFYNSTNEFKYSFPIDQFRTVDDGFKIGVNVFTRNKISINVDGDFPIKIELTNSNHSEFKNRYSINPFNDYYLSIVSLRHDVTGTIQIDSNKLNVMGHGHIEKSFGKQGSLSYTRIFANSFSMNKTLSIYLFDSFIIPRSLLIYRILKLIPFNRYILDLKWSYGFVYSSINDKVVDLSISKPVAVKTLENGLEFSIPDSGMNVIVDYISKGVVTERLDLVEGSAMRMVDAMIFVRIKHPTGADEDYSANAYFEVNK